MDRDVLCLPDFLTTTLPFYPLSSILYLLSSNTASENVFARLDLVNTKQGLSIYMFKARYLTLYWPSAQEILP